MNITFPDGSVKQFEDGMTALQIAETISQKLKKATLAAEIDGQRADAFRPIHGDHTLKLLTWQDEDGRWTMRHTASHILAQAVKRVHPEAKLAIGPAIENGFYYDFDAEPFTPPKRPASIRSSAASPQASSPQGSPVSRAASVTLGVTTSAPAQKRRMAATRLPS